HQAHRAQLTGELASVRQTLERLHRRERAAVQARAAEDLRLKLENARTCVRRITELSSRRDAIKVTATGAARIDEITAAITRLEAEAAASSQMIEFSYLEGARVAFEVEGRPINPGERLQVDRELVITVPGIGHLKLVPGADASAAAAQLAMQRRLLDEALS